MLALGTVAARQHYGRLPPPLPAAPDAVTDFSTYLMAAIHNRLNRYHVICGETLSESAKAGPSRRSAHDAKMGERKKRAIGIAVPMTSALCSRAKFHAGPKSLLVVAACPALYISWRICWM